MFRLVKLAAYALLGYVLYELFLGISEGEPDRQAGGGGGQQRQRRGQQSRSGGGGGGSSGGGGAGATISGPGEGRKVPVSDASGAEHNERVGRGVVTR
jgi:hypothetical protein